MNTYICFYRNRQISIVANSSYEAQKAAALEFKAKKSYDVTVMLSEKNNQPVTHSTASL